MIIAYHWSEIHLISDRALRSGTKSVRVGDGLEPDNACQRIPAGRRDVQRASGTETGCGLDYST